jgi:hypothetical protein
MASLAHGASGSIVVIAALLVALAGSAHGQGSYFGVQGPQYYPSSGVPNCTWSIAGRCKAAPAPQARKVRAKPR